MSVLSLQRLRFLYNAAMFARPDDFPLGTEVMDEAPGEFPYSRGIQPTMYRGRPWTMRQYAGFGTAAESNARYRYLLSEGVTGLSVAFDLPTQMGYDSDHPLAAGEVGRVGVDLDDHQRDRDHPARPVRCGRTAAGSSAVEVVGDDSERCPEGIRRARHLH